MAISRKDDPQTSEIAENSAQSSGAKASRLVPVEVLSMRAGRELFWVIADQEPLGGADCCILLPGRRRGVRSETWCERAVRRRSGRAAPR